MLILAGRNSSDTVEKRQIEISGTWEGNLAKFAMTGILKLVTGVEIPIWQMVYRLCLYYMIRAVTIFAVHPQMAKAQKEAMAERIRARGKEETE